MTSAAFIRIGRHVDFAALPFFFLQIREFARLARQFQGEKPGLPLRKRFFLIAREFGLQGLKPS